MKSMPIMKGCSTSGTLRGEGEQQEELGLETRHPNKAVKGCLWQLPAWGAAARPGR